MARKLQLLETIRFLLYVSPFVFPLYLVRFQLVGIPFTFLEAFVYFVFAVWVVEIIRDHRSIKWDARTRNTSLLVFLLLIAATVGVLVAPTAIPLPSGQVLDAKLAAMGIWKGWIFAPILYFILLTQVISTKDDVAGILRSFVYSSAVVAIASYGLALFGEGLTYDFRLSGFYESANYLSLYLVPAVLLNIYFILKNTSSDKKQSALDIATLTVMIHALFFTQSYAAILAVFGAIVLYGVYYAFKHPKHLKQVGLALLALIIAFNVIIFTQLDSRKFQQFLDFENRSSTTVRLEVYEISYNLLKRYPMWGHGLGLYEARYQTEGPEILQHPPMEWHIPHPHNVFLAFWLNAGLLGFIAFVGILALAHLPFTYPLVGLWGLVLHGLFDNPFWKNDLAMIFWLIIASIIILQNAANPPKVKKSRSKRKPAKRAKKRA